MRKYSEDFEKAILQLYEQRKTDKEIAEILQVKCHKIAHFRKKYNLKANYHKIFDDEKSKILQLIRSGCSLKRIKKITGFGRDRLSRFLHRNGFTDLRKLTFKNLNVGPREASILTGILLGDGNISYIDPTNPYGYKKNARFTVRHGPKQKEYSFYIYHTLHMLNPTIRRVYVKSNIIKGKKVQGQYQTEVRMSKSTFFINMYKTFYPNGKKILPIDWLAKYYTSESLAFHFMDDGSKCADVNGKINGFILSTNSFSLEEVEKFKYFLMGRFELYSTIQFNNHKPVLRISAKSVLKFINIVKPFIIDSLKYKISSSSKTPLNGKTP